MAEILPSSKDYFKALKLKFKEKKKYERFTTNRAALMIPRGNECTHVFAAVRKPKNFYESDLREYNVSVEPASEYQ